MEIVKIVVLSLSGLLLLFVGSMRLSNPIKTYLKNSGITLPNDTDLLNEIRGVSSVMLFGGFIILLGILFPKISFTSHVIATLLFLGFAVGRLISSSVDGKPNKQITQGLIFELVFGLVNTYFLVSSLM